MPVSVNVIQEWFVLNPLTLEMKLGEGIPWDTRILSPIIYYLNLGNTSAAN